MLIYFVGFVIGFALVEMNLTANYCDEVWIDYMERRYDLY